MNHYSSLNTIPCSFQTSLTLCALKKIAHLQNNSTKWGSCQGVWGGHKTKTDTEEQKTVTIFSVPSFKIFFTFPKDSQKLKVNSDPNGNKTQIVFFTMTMVAILALYFLVPWPSHTMRKEAQATKCNFGVLNTPLEKHFF